MVAVKHEPASRADMRPHREALLDTPMAATALLAREGWLDRNNGYVMHASVGGQPREEASPGGIADGLRQLPVFHQVAYLEVFVGNQIVR